MQSRRVSLARYRMRFILTGLLVGSMVSMLSCQRPDSGSIDIIGSTTVTPLMEHLVAAYSKTHEQRFLIQSLGSTTGINAVRDGQTPIGMSSRHLTQEEIDAGVVAYHIATEALAVAVNIRNPISNLTQEQIIAVFSGKTMNWRDVGGVDRPIVVVSRETGSGARSTFEALMHLIHNRESLVDHAPLLIVGDGTGQVRANVASRFESIGYMSLSVIDNINVKSLSIDGIDPSPENIKNGSYVLQEPLFLLLRQGENGPAREFVDWVLSAEGQSEVARFGSITVSQ
ncbi:phosphate ABC transporter substrate-binding protein [Entomospira entomophila]|uniref:Phosphate ABC transporter substrate-binding protein n=1 Tax=Entomospira entomophila TaxID=2719988 RepID=A0A968G9B2_9SPIO|nr:phosphate ABC transporter substrate-binding protein [Entomospira entomophilus]NIZ40953.1 phosphate ABC transporter substrate-binding protein [Entomospira entomophilus]WDI35166.1 phosphate ABC transporter substrate-binding protein [Entomospira entomophilus]